MLKGKVAAISGAASKRGIGLAIARAMADQGARIAVLDLDAEAAQQAADSLGDGHTGVACDVTDADQCRAAIARVEERLGPVDILVNNAGITQPLKIMDIGPAEYDAVTDVNLRGTLQLSQAVIPGMRERGRGTIVCMSSVSAQRGGGIFGGPHYSAAKAGVLGLMRNMARELGPDGIRVNAICPGLIETDITGGALTDERKEDICEGIPLKRVGQPSDVAGACVFLASELAAYVTGAVIDVNGGMHIH
ncbi:short-chain dehydrogenase [Rhodovibrio sodomensis]|uniref:Short-chain dehydrogenase n=1 Tax=Rhodovibrio sodomensis TaxID=1088 RepID=A0ABS1DHV7_9PROT|nr:SDR family oxidoreductase [Rhodovibrio sodomensis]MBK1669581.1 short-chain dehydrogenase [Rhodovibrio sodomensis]